MILVYQSKSKNAYLISAVLDEKLRRAWGVQRRRDDERGVVAAVGNIGVGLDKKEREKERVDKKVDRDVVAKEGKEEQQNVMQRERCALQWGQRHTRAALSLALSLSRSSRYSPHLATHPSLKQQLDHRYHPFVLLHLRTRRGARLVVRLHRLLLLLCRRVLLLPRERTRRVSLEVLVQQS